MSQGFGFIANSWRQSVTAHQQVPKMLLIPFARLRNGPAGPLPVTVTTAPAWCITASPASSFLESDIPITRNTHPSTADL